MTQNVIKFNKKLICVLLYSSLVLWRRFSRFRSDLATFPLPNKEGEKVGGDGQFNDSKQLNSNQNKSSKNHSSRNSSSQRVEGIPWPPSFTNWIVSKRFYQPLASTNLGRYLSKIAPKTRDNIFCGRSRPLKIGEGLDRAIYRLLGVDTG